MTKLPPASGNMWPERTRWTKLKSLLQGSQPCYIHRHMHTPQKKLASQSDPAQLYFVYALLYLWSISSQYFFSISGWKGKTENQTNLKTNARSSVELWFTQASATETITVRISVVPYQYFIKILLYLTHIHKIIVNWVTISEEYVYMTVQDNYFLPQSCTKIGACSRLNTNLSEM